MIELLNKYNGLPQELRDKLSQPAIVAAVKNLESKYGLSLAVAVMKVMVKELSLDDLIPYFTDSCGLSLARGRELALDLRHTVFFTAADYLGLSTAKKVAPTDIASTKIAPPAAREEVKSLEPVSAPKVDEQEAKIAKIIAQAGVVPSGSELNKRLKSVLGTYLKGVRNRLAAKDALTRSADSGGVSLGVIDAEKILNAADGKSDSIVSFGPALRDVEYDFSRLTKTKELLPADDLPELTAAPEQEFLPTPESVIIEPLPQPVAVKEPEKPQEPQPVVVAPTPEPVKSNWRKDVGGKIVMEDIKGAPRVFTPIDELQFMTVKNFRQLSEKPDRATELIKQKIKTLEEDDFVNKFEAMSAWKSSPVNRMYVEVCQSALNQGQPLNKALAKKRRDDPDFLTDEEFEAIIKLNKSLTMHQ